MTDEQMDQLSALVVEHLISCIGKKSGSMYGIGMDTALAEDFHTSLVAHGLSYDVWKRHRNKLLEARDKAEAT